MRAVNIEDLARKFWKKGYLAIEGFFPSPLVNRADQEITRYFGMNPEFRHEEEFLSRSKTEVIPWFPQNPGMEDYSQATAAVFDELESAAGLAELTAAILGDDWSALYSMVMFSRKGTVGQAWHQDCPPETSSRFNLNRLVYTRGLSADEGGLVVVMPGSHRLGMLPEGEPHEDLENQVVITPSEGMLVILHGHTWHRVLPVNGNYRFSINFRACPRGTPEDITDVCVYRNMRYRFSTAEVIEER
jgi:hypothetical protein